MSPSTVKFSRSARVHSACVGVLLFTFELSGVFPGSAPQAQPVTVPPLTAPAFNQTDFEPFFAAAREQNSIPAWEVLINQAGILLGAQWEAQVDAQIDAELAGLNQTDAFNSPAEYRDYIRRELQVQKQNAYAGWELQAMATIEAERNVFLTNLSSLDPSHITDDSKRAIEIGRSNAASGENAAADPDSFDDLLASVNNQQATWQDQFKEDYEAGLYQYSQALSGIEKSYDEFVQSLAQKDLEFQSNLNQIQAYEDNVRAGIGAQLTVMENTLQSNGVFHAETCTPENVCSLDANTLNTAGTQLQALITSMRTGLQNGASLTNLSNQMITYLQASRQQAEADRQDWVTLTSNTETLPTFAIGLQGQGTNGHLVIPELGALANFYNGDQSFLNSMVRQISAQPAYRSVTVNSADGYGYTPPALLPIVIPFFSQLGGLSERFSAVREGAFIYAYTENDPFGIGSGNTYTTIISESEFIFEITYTWHDSNAQANQDRWAGYVNDLDGMLAQWQNTILPAANAWEIQKQQYNANYQAWQSAAQTQQATALATTQQNRDLVIAGRNQFISTTSVEYRKGENAWRDIETKIVAARDSASDLNATSTTIIDRINQIGSAPGVGNNLSEILRNLGTLPQPSSEFLNRNQADLPDLQNLSIVGNGLRDSLNGASNYSLTSATQESFERERSKVRKMLKEMLETSRLANTSSADIAVTLFMQRLEPAQLVRLQGMEQKDLVRHINSSLGLAADGDLTVNAVERFSQLYGVEFEKPIHELITERRTDATNAVWNVQEIDGGKLRATRQIKDGNAFLRFGADGTKDDSYIAGEQEQVLEFAAPAVMKLADTDGLFEQWETKTILTNFSEQLDQFAGHSKEQQAAVWNTGSKADAYRNAKDGQFRQNVQSQTFIASIIKAALTSALTGGNAIEGASGVVRGRVMGPIYSALETATGIPAGIWGSLAGGASIDQAIISHGFGMIEEATGVPGLASMLQQEWGKMQARQARREAQRFRPEDLLPAGPLTLMTSQLAYSSNPLVANYGRATTGMLSPTYAWRNAQHHQDGAVALQVVETVGAAVIQTAGVIIPGLGNATATAIIAGYQAAKQGYLGSLNGGTRGAIAGIASGAVGGVVRHYTGGMANVGFSYSYEDGFGVQAGATLPLLGGANGGLTLGIGGSWNEREGITGTNASLGFSTNVNGGPGLFGGVNYDSNQGVHAAVGLQDSNGAGTASAALTYAPEEGFGAEINFGLANGDLPGFLAGGSGTLSYTQNSGMSASFENAENSIDQLELSFNQHEGFEANFTAPGRTLTYGPDGLSLRPNADYWTDFAGLDIIPELNVAGFDLGYDFDKGFTAVLPGDGEDVFNYNQADGASSPYFDALEQQAQQQIDAIENAGRIGDKIEALVGVVQNPGDYMDLDPFGGQNPFEDLPDLSGLFGEEDGEAVAGGPAGNGENGSDPGEEGEIAGGGSPDGGEIVGHRGGGTYTPDGYKISKHASAQVEILKDRFAIDASSVQNAERSLADCEAIAVPAGGSEREEALISQINCFAAIPTPPDILADSTPSLSQLGAQSYSRDFIDFVQIAANEARVTACRASGKGPQNCTILQLDQCTVKSYHDPDTRRELQLEAEQLNRFESERDAASQNVAGGVAYVSTFSEDRGAAGGGVNLASFSTSDDFTNDWLQNSQTGRLLGKYSEVAAKSDLLRRQAERELYQLSMQEDARTAMKATDFGGLENTDQADREQGLVAAFAEEVYQLAVQMKNTVANFAKDIATSAKKDFDAFVASLDTFLSDPFSSTNFFNFMEKTSDFGGNPAMIPVVSVPPAGQLFGRGFSVADLVTSMRKGELLGSVAGLWGVLSGTKTGDWIADYGKDQITKSKLVQNVSAAASEKLKKLSLMPCPSCKGCVDAGTPILTPSGYRPIESLRVGDTVIAYDTEAGRNVERKVTKLHRDITIEWYEIRVGADTLTVTDNHPFWLPERGEWVPARDLEIGTVLHPQDGTAARISQITVRQLRRSEPIYNVEIEGDHNYFAGEGAVLVHNGGGNDGEDCFRCAKTLLLKKYPGVPKQWEKARYVGLNRSSFHGNTHVDPLTAFTKGISPKGASDTLTTSINQKNSGFTFSSTEPLVALQPKFSKNPRTGGGFVYEIKNPQNSVDIKKAFPESTSRELGELARFGKISPEDITGVQIRTPDGQFLKYTKEEFLRLPKETILYYASLAK